MENFIFILTESNFRVDQFAKDKELKIAGFVKLTLINL